MSAAQPEPIRTARIDPHVEWDPAVLDEIRQAAVDGLLRLGHGGLEAGGVLFGTVAGGVISVRAQREVPCEHALGPSFSLSEKDRAAFAEVLRSPDSDPDLAGIEAVGWYCSHTRTDLQLLERDQELHDRFFAQADRILLLVKPSKFERSRGLVLARSEAGGLTPLGEELDLGGGLPAVRAQRSERIRAEAEPAVDPVVDPAVDPVPVPLIPQGQPEATRPAGTWRLLLIAAGVILLLACTAAIGIRFSKIPSPAPAIRPVALRVSDGGSTATIQWDPQATVLEHASQALLEVREGDRSPQTIALQAGAIRQGQFIYPRSSDTLQIDMNVNGARSGAVTLIAPLPKPPAAALAGESDRKRSEDPKEALEKQLAAMKAELQRLQSEKAAVPVASPGSGPAAGPVRRFDPKSLRGIAGGRPPAGVPELPAPSIAVVQPGSELPAISGPILPAPVPAPPAGKANADAARSSENIPASGRFIWTGHLRRGGLLYFDDKHASMGSTTGHLPGAPVRVHVFAGELQSNGIVLYTPDPGRRSAEPPSARNGWNRTTYVWDPKRGSDMTVLEVPSSRNEWKQLVVRSENHPISIVIVDWEALPASRREKK